MQKYLLTRQAEIDLQDVFEYSVVRFGAYQAEAYFEGLYRTFGLISDFPRIGTAVLEFGPVMRRFRFQSHHIYYSLEDDHVLIRSILHVRQQPRGDLFE